SGRCRRFRGRARPAAAPPGAHPTARTARQGTPNIRAARAQAGAGELCWRPGPRGTAPEFSVGGAQGQ
ncbi:hypothetical protein IWQ56_005180, partial [Coemansia nantahalensis]